jgi:tRNA-dihydrouridine synthase
METLAEIVARSPIPVIGNGGVYSRWHRDEMVDRVRPYAIMVAGGAIGNPWLFARLSGPPPWPGARPAAPVPDPAPPLEEFIAAVREHVEETVRYYGERSGFPRTRKLILRYLKGRGFPREVKLAVSRLGSRPDLDELLRIMLSCRVPLLR